MRGQCLDAARRFYAGRAFVRVTDKPPQTKWATGSNLAFVSYAADPERNLGIAPAKTRALVATKLHPSSTLQAEATQVIGDIGCDGVPVAWTRLTVEP